jgi:hypothetical protein
MLSTLRRARDDDRGITLAELVVAMGIATILATVAMFFFVGAERTGYTSVLTNQNTADARLTLGGWTSMLRVAGWLDTSTKTDRFEEITPTKIVFYANLDNANHASQVTDAPTKVALLLRTTNAATGDGQLVEIVFKPDNTTPKSVRQLAFNAAPTGGPGHAVFQPFNQVGGTIDVTSTQGCVDSITNRPVVGLCLQSPPAGAGMIDPTVASSSLAVSAGPLRGNPTVNVDGVLDGELHGVSGVTVAFTVSDPSHTASMDFAAGASVNSGAPS